MPNTLISLDFVCCFQYKAEAEQFYRRLSKRMENFGLELEMSKSRLIEFGRYAEENRKCRGEGKPETFTFLGLTHYCSHSKSGNFRVKRKTSKKKFAKKCKEVHRLIFAIGTLLGTLAGYFGGWIDVVIMRISDMMISFPVSGADSSAASASVSCSSLSSSASTMHH